MNRRIAFTLGIVAVAALASARQGSQFHPELPAPKRSTTISEPEVLKGLPGVSVLVESTGVDEKAIGVTQAGLTDTVENALERHDIEVLTPAQRLTVLGRPRLYLSVNVLQGAYSVALRMDEVVRPENNPRTIIGGATVWEKSAIGFHGGDNQVIRKHVEKLVDAFAGDYLEANPKK